MKFVTTHLFIQFVFILMSLLNVNQVLAEASISDSSQPAQMMNDLLADIQSIKASFIQASYSPSSGFQDQITGELLLAKPMSFHWITRSPYQQAIYSEGTTLWQIDHDLEQVNIQVLSDDILQTPLLVLKGDVEALIDSYEVTLNEISPNEKIFQLIPITEDALFKSLSLKFVKNQLAGMELYDHFDQRTMIDFTDIQQNLSEIPNDQFIPELPTSYDVIDTRISESHVRPAV